MPAANLPGLGVDSDPPISERARSLRAGAWGMVLLAGLALFLVFAGARRWLPRGTVGLGLFLLCGASIAAVWLGYKAQQRAVADRDRSSRQAMIVLIAAQLGKQDDATLTRIAGKGGPAAEAARMILKGRSGGSSRVATPGPRR